MRKGQTVNEVRQLGQTDDTGTPLVFRDYLIKNDITQTEAAYKIGVTVSSLSKWERHLSQPKMKNIAMIELVFGIPDARGLFPRVWPHLMPDEYKGVSKE